jgi:hypothetical protein
MTVSSSDARKLFIDSGYPARVATTNLATYVQSLMPCHDGFWTVPFRENCFGGECLRGTLIDASKIDCDHIDWIRDARFGIWRISRLCVTPLISLVVDDGARRELGFVVLSQLYATMWASVS